MQARFYAPWYGRFLSPDPARDQHFEETQSWNIYSYVRNNPVTHIDPNGMEDYPIFDMPQMRVLSLTQSGIPGGRAERMVAQEQQQRTVMGGTATAALATGGVASSPVGAAIAGAGRAALGWLTSTGAAVVQGAKDLFNRGSQAAQAKVWNPVNGSGPLGEKVASTFRSSTYTESVTSEATTLYRTFGGEARELGAYWTRTPPSGALQSTIDSALNPAWGNTAANVVKINVPAGTRMFEGVAAQQGGLVGGGNQVFLQKVDPSWVVK